MATRNLKPFFVRKKLKNGAVRVELRASNGALLMQSPKYPRPGRADRTIREARSAALTFYVLDR